jgi:SNF2 family DNA or RNA helicase
MFYVEKDDHLIAAMNLLDLTTKLRQTLVCPRLLSPSLDLGAAIYDFAATMPKDQHHVIFTPFTKAIPHFKNFLENQRGDESFRVYTLQGGMGTPERDNTIRLFRQEPSVLICSVLYAQAFSLEPATRCFFIGYDWDPDNNRQAEKRLHRLTTQNPISCYYYTFRSTFDERLCDILNIKQQHLDLTIPGNLRQLLKG